MSPMVGLGLLGGALMGGAGVMSNMAAQRQAQQAAQQAAQQNSMMVNQQMQQNLSMREQTNNQILEAQKKANQQKAELVASLGPSVDPSKLGGISTIETSPLGDQSKPNLAGNKLLGN